MRDKTMVVILRVTTQNKIQTAIVGLAPFLVTYGSQQSYQFRK